MSQFLQTLIAGAALLTLTACGGGTHSHNGPEDHTHGPVEVSNARIMPPLAGRDVVAGYMRLDNKGAADRLISASSPIATKVEIHNHIETNGVMQMRRVDGVDLPEGASVEFQPGGYHLMLFGVNIPDDLTETTLTLDYETGEDVTLVAPIVGRGEEGEAMDHSKMDHSKMDHSGH